MIDLVYVLGSTETHRVKIGHSTNIPKRVADIQRMSPVPLHVLLEIEGGSSLEADLHRRFQVFRTHGEWFDFGNVDPIAAVADAIEAIHAEERRVALDRAREEAALAELGTLTEVLQAAINERSRARDALQEAIVRHLKERNAPPGKVAEHTPYDRNHVRRIAEAGGVEPLRAPTVKSAKTQE